MGIDHHAVLLRVTDIRESEQPAQEGVEVVDLLHEQLGIDEARALTERAYTRPSEAAVQLLLVRTLFITHEAQNALLKLLEEPPESTRFLFLAPPDLQLLPTLASRLVVEVAEQQGSGQMFEDFCNADLSDRLSQIETAAKSKDTEWMRQIKQGLLSYSSSDSMSEKEAVEIVSRLLLTRGASNKMLLEHVALTLPRPAGK
tara:strand:+ start:11529 stop:12131 length:603 start_codon:yes stop_codon:yes gene_type:complete